ncbi:hypothetical protein DPM19_13780 [Actinomadura craniellae]|uniref:Uncharacterized protein n=1 Tax=Actinomadura craniellae TaxID=2231787 RepID=A0A365H6T4_9ACTN|nr:hypothetical protein [Actinomadura craniellae]RAY14797.1 hypothetical protein DPM19_13780 [Actinomadura craniellae]
MILTRQLSRGAVAVAIGLASVGALAPSASADALTWEVVHQVDRQVIYGVVPVTRRDVWALTGTRPQQDYRSRPLSLRWNGSAWRRVATPTGLTGVLTAGDALSPTDVWAIGGEEGGPSYALRWDGAQWNVAGRWEVGDVTGITVLGPSDVWVFGAHGRDWGAGTWHYDGATWTKMETPFAIIKASDVSPTDIWGIARGASGDTRTVVHYDGTSWQEVPTGDVLPPDIPYSDATGTSQSVFLSGIVARSAQDVWVTGTVSRTENEVSTQQPVLIRWNGTRWRRVDVPGAGAIDKITPDGRRGFWFAARPGPEEPQVIRHRSGGGVWTTAAVTTPAGTVPALYDLALVPGTRQVYGVGLLQAVDPVVHNTGAIFRLVR